MEDVEAPIEHLKEELHRAAHNAQENWIKWSALISALRAVMAAIAGMQSGHEVNEAMIEQIKASDAWSYYQAKGIKGMLAETLPQQNNETKQKIKKYHEEQETIKQHAESKTTSSAHHLRAHEILARSVTLFQVAIAMTAIAVLTRRKGFLLFSLAIGLLGAFFFAQYWML